MRVLNQVLRRDRRTIGLRVRLLSTPNIDNARNDIQASDDVIDDDIERRERSNENVDDNIGQANVDNDNVARVVCRDVLFDDSAQDVISALGAPGNCMGPIYSKICGQLWKNSLILIFCSLSQSKEKFH